jgi:protein-disulfide isomerase
MEMKTLLVGLFMAVTAFPAAAQQRGVFIGVDDDPVLGSPDAKVLIIEFGDYQCPSCRMFWKDIEPRLKKDYIDTGKVKLVFRDFPLMQIHPEALMAAMAVNCAGEQEKYWQFHDKVFREQYNKGDDIIRMKAADLKKWAKDIGVDQAKFDQCLDSEKFKNEVLKDKADGDAAGVQGTPTFFINGRAIGGAQQYPEYRKLIDELLKQ